MNKTQLNLRKAIDELEALLRFTKRHPEYCEQSSIEDDTTVLLDDVRELRQAHDPE